MPIVYQTIPDKDIRKQAKDSKKEIRAWFKANPKRLSCNAAIWYGKRVIILPDHIDTIINGEMEIALKRKKRKIKS